MQSLLFFLYHDVLAIKICATPEHFIQFSDSIVNERKIILILRRI